MEYKTTGAVKFVRGLLILVALTMSIAIAADFSYDAADSASLTAGLPAKASKVLSMFNDLKDYINAVSGEWVTTKHIIDGGVTGIKVNSSAMGNGLTKDGSGNMLVDLAAISALDFSSGSLAAQIDDSTVGIDGSNQLYIKTGGVTTTQILDETIAAADIALLTITADQLATDAVSTIKIQDGAVTADKLAADAVTTTTIPDDAVTIAKIAALWSGTVGTAVNTTYGDALLKVKYVTLTNAASPDTSDFTSYGFGTSYQHFYIPVGHVVNGGTSKTLQVVNVLLPPLTGVGAVYGTNTDGSTVGGTLYALVVGIQK